MRPLLADTASNQYRQQYNVGPFPVNTMTYVCIDMIRCELSPWSTTCSSEYPTGGWVPGFNLNVKLQSLTGRVHLKYGLVVIRS